MTDTKPKVYCKGCRWCTKMTGQLWNGDEKGKIGTAVVCLKTLVRDSRRSAYLETYNYEIIDIPNNNNDCPNREQKKWWMFWRG